MSDERDLRAGGRSERGSDPARRILGAARDVILERGFEGARISDIAQAARVARGAIFYYFGTKEHLAAEVLRAEGEARLESLRAHLGPAASLDELVRGMVAELASFTDAERGSHVLAQQIGGAALSSREIRAARQALHVRWREDLTEILLEKARAGVIELPAHATVVAVVLTGLGQGIANESISDPAWDPRPAIAFGERLARSLLAREEPLASIEP